MLAQATTKGRNATALYRFNAVLRLKSIAISQPVNQVIHALERLWSKTWWFVFSYPPTSGNNDKRKSSVKLRHGKYRIIQEDAREKAHFAEHCCIKELTFANFFYVTASL
jgi:hypothetical protein